MKKQFAHIVILLMFIVILSMCLIACDRIITTASAYDFEDRLESLGYSVDVYDLSNSEASLKLAGQLWRVTAFKHKDGQISGEVIPCRVNIVKYESEKEAKAREDIAARDGYSTYRRGDILIVATNQDALNDALGKNS